MKNFSKLLTLLITIGLFIMPVASNATLYDYFSEQGQKLPSIAERVEMASTYGIDNYSGLFDQNNTLEGFLRSNSLKLGGNTPVSGITWYLSSPISDTDTTLTFSKVTDIRGNTLATTNLPTKIYFVIEPYNTSNTEIAVCPSSGYSSSDKQFTGCTRGLAFYGSSESAVTANKKSHSSGSPVVMTNVGQFFNNFVDIDGDQTIGGNKIFASSTAPLDQRIGLGTTTPAYLTNNAGVLYYCNNGASCAAIGAGANTYSFITPLGVSGSEVSIATSTYWFDLDSGDNLGIATTTGLGLSDFWNEEWTSTTTHPGPITIDGNLDIGSLSFDGDETTTKQFTNNFYCTSTAQIFATGSDAEYPLISYTLPANTLGVYDSVKVKAFVRAFNNAAGTNAPNVAFRIDGVTTTAWDFTTIDRTHLNFDLTVQNLNSLSSNWLVDESFSNFITGATSDLIARTISLTNATTTMATTTWDFANDVVFEIVQSVDAHHYDILPLSMCIEVIRNYSTD